MEALGASQVEKAGDDGGWQGGIEMIWKKKREKLYQFCAMSAIKIMLFSLSMKEYMGNKECECTTNVKLYTIRYFLSPKENGEIHQSKQGKERKMRAIVWI